MTPDSGALLFLLKKTVAHLILPPVGPLCLIVLGLLLLRHQKRLAATLMWAGVAATLWVTQPHSVSLMLRGLEVDPPITLAQLEQAEAIVILGGGKRHYAPEYAGETLNRLSLERVRYGARLALASGLPVLVTGGQVYGDAAESDLMQGVLEQEFNVPVRWNEAAARDTRENARYSAALLREAGIRHIALVTHAVHMPRARAEFEAQGLQVTAAPTAWLGGPGGVTGWLPDAHSAYAGWIATHEWLGRLAYALSR